MYCSSGIIGFMGQTEVMLSTRHPVMVELTALAGMSVRKIVTQDLVFKVSLDFSLILRIS